MSDHAPTGLPEDFDITSRKAQHLKVCIEDQVEVPLRRGAPFDAIRLVHQALPECDLDAVDPSTRFLGKPLAFPLMIGSMTGGTPEAGLLNKRLAQAAAHCGVGMFLGSQRIMVERAETAETFEIRDVAPEIPLIANIGAVQLNYGVDADDIAALARRVGADGVVFHLNAAQEACQPAGDLRFSGLTGHMAEAVAALASLGIPCGAKEVGSGLSSAAVKRLTAMPLSFLESAGKGGTSWTLIEGLRATDDIEKRMGHLFADWGVPTVTSMLNCVQYGRGIPVIASGGLRSGVDGAKAIAAGASLCAMALPLLKAAVHGVDAIVRELETFKRAFKTAMFLTGAKTIAELRSVPKRIDPAVRPDVWEGREDR